MQWDLSLEGIEQVVLVGALAYVSLLVLLRVSGNRTFPQLNALDLVGSVALGSALASVVLTKETSLIEGGMGFALIVGMQLAFKPVVRRLEGWLQRERKGSADVPEVVAGPAATRVG